MPKRMASGQSMFLPGVFYDTASKSVVGSISEYCNKTLIKIEQYSITYELDGGKNSASNPASYTSKSDTVTLKAPTKKGYTFKGWYSDSKFQKQVKKISKGSTGNITLYAKWVKK